MASRKLKSSLAAGIERSTAHGRSTPDAADEFSKVVAQAIREEDAAKSEIIKANIRKKERKQKSDAEIAAWVKLHKQQEAAPPEVVRGEMFMSHDLNAAQHGLTLNEKRLVHVAASKLVPNLTPHPPVTVTLDDWQNVFGGTRNAAREALKDGAEQLSVRRYVRKVFDDELGKNVPRRFRWVKDDFPYVDGRIKINFHEDVLPELVNLTIKDGFTILGLQLVSGLRSKHSIRLLEMICQWRSTGKLVLRLDDLRFRLEAPECYDSFGLLKAKILDPAIKELSQKANVNVKLTEKREGRVVKSVAFSFVFKDQASKERASA